MQSCKLPVFLILFAAFLISAGPANAQDESPWPFTRTDVGMNVIFDAATYDDEPLQPGDWIGVFTPAELCAGVFQVTENEDIGLTAWGDDVNTRDTIDGFDFDEELVFKVWISEVEGELPTEITNIRRGEAVWDEGALLICTIAAIIEGPPEIEISGDVEFPEIWVDYPDSLAMQIHNAGVEDLIISDVAVTDGSEYFIPEFEEEITIRWLETIDFYVTYHPMEAGEHNATITIYSNSNDEENHETTFEISGSARVPDPPTIALPDLEMVENVYQYMFRETRLDRSRGYFLNIHNEGEETLTIDDVTFDREDDIFTYDLGFIEILGGQSSRMLITFSPVDVAEYQATMTIFTNDEENGQLAVNLSGNGIVEGDPEIILERDEYFFPNVVVGRQAQWRMRIINWGAGDLHVDSIESDNEAFTFDFPADPVRLRPDDFYNVNVYFEVNDPGYYSGTLTIFNDDPENEEFTCELGARAVEEDELHFRYYPSEINHSLLIDTLTLDGEQMAEGDEVGIFTEAGFCAGGGVVDAEGICGTIAYGDDQESEVVDGFAVNEEFIFVVWDADANDEAGGVAEFTLGPEVFTINGLTRLNLVAETGDPEPDIELSDDLHYFGQADYDDEQVKEWSFDVLNIGVGDLVVEGVDSDLDEYWIEIDGEFPVTLGQNEPLAVDVFFGPTAEEEYEGRLTIRSNDPLDDILYLDLFGVGVDTVMEPDFEIDRYNHFFGVQHVLAEDADPYEFVLTIYNTGGGDLILENFDGGGDAFATDIDVERPMMIEAEGSGDITVYFHPLAEGTFDGWFSATTNDPTEEEVVFNVRGIGAVSDDRFLHHQTADNHSIAVTEAIVYTLGGDETWLVPGDEIAVFTPSGLCAGHTVVTAEDVADGEIGLTAWSNDPETEFQDGFNGGEEFTFKFWDWTVRDELDMYGPENEIQGVTWDGEGDEVFRVNGVSGVELRAPAIHDESQIFSDPEIHNFGPIHVDDDAVFNMIIGNSGGIDLTITQIESDTAVFVHNFNNEEEIVLAEDESFELEVTFTPDHRAAFEGTITIHSDDPDQNEFEIHPVGMGSEAEGYYQWFRTNSDHSILILDIEVGGGLPPIGDEFAVFTSAGLCAGAERIVDPEADIGVGAFGDDNQTEFLVEGFERDEVINLRYWDASQEVEYAVGDEEHPIELELIQGDMEWLARGVTLIAVSIPGAIGPIPVLSIETAEGEEITFDLAMTNQDEVDYEWTADFDIDALDGEAVLEAVDNHFTFTWPIGFAAVLHEGDPPFRAVYELNFTVTAEGYEDGLTVSITIDDVNQAPEVVNPLANDELIIDEDADTTLVANLVELFDDVDELDELLFYWDEDVEIEGVTQWIDREDENLGYYVIPDSNWFGEGELVIVADDRRDENRDGRERQLRSTIADREVSLRRSLRLTTGLTLPGDTPNRDTTTGYRWTLIVNPVNDAPVIIEPDEDEVWNAPRVDELDIVAINFVAEDVDNANEDLTWAVTDDGGLPQDAWEFVDNGDGTADFTWQTTQEDAREDPYTPVFTVSDNDVDNEGLDAITVNINLNDVNRDPYLVDPPPTESLEEDQDPDQAIDIVDLAEIFFDDDQEDVLTYNIDRRPPNLGLNIDENTGILSARPIPEHFNTWDLDADEDAPLRVEISAQDLAGAEVVWAFDFSITWVNDPPEAFALLEPADQSEIEWIPDSSYLFDVSWEEANQVRFELDTVRYVLWITEQGIEDTAFIGPMFLNFIEGVDIRDIAEELGLPVDDDYNYNIRWGVRAYDDTPEYLDSTPQAFRLTVRVLSVRLDDLGIPDVFSLSPAYPNPFNAQTTVRFGLPQSAAVDISVWDMHGRKVATLAQGQHVPGYYEAVWDASGLSSGVYIIRMDTPVYRNIQKAILLR